MNEKKTLIKDLSDRQILEFILVEVQQIHQHLNWQVDKIKKSE